MKIEEGKGVVRGIASGEPYLNKRNSFELNSCHKIEQEEIALEEKRFKKAVEDSKEEIRFLKSNLDEKIEKSDLQILTVHLMMLEDPMFLKEIEKGIKKDLISAECSVKRAAEKIINLFEKIEDPLYKQRALDIKDISERVIHNIILAENKYQDMNGKILIKDELLP
ncbi:MAG: phosphoenolpyruvate-utilizing N-terminal domain-containing protein, partial [Cetobacterium sp.]